jgi:hypothetical protein
MSGLTVTYEIPHLVACQYASSVVSLLLSACMDPNATRSYIITTVQVLSGCEHTTLAGCEHTTPPPMPR